MRTQCPTCGGACQVAVEKSGSASIAASPGMVPPPNVDERAAAEAPPPNPLHVVTIVVAERCRNCAGEGWVDGFSPPS